MRQDGSSGLLCSYRPGCVARPAPGTVSLNGGEGQESRKRGALSHVTRVGPANQDPVTRGHAARQSGGWVSGRGREKLLLCDWRNAPRRPRGLGASGSARGGRGCKRQRRQSSGSGCCSGDGRKALNAEFRGAGSCHLIILRGARAAAAEAAEAEAAHGSKSALRLLGSSSAGRDKGSCELQATPDRVVRLPLPSIRALKAETNSSL